MLDGKVIIVTGAASGIGLASAHVFASYGARIAIVDRDSGKAETAAHEVGQLGGGAIAISADVSEEGAVEQMVKRARSHFGRLDGAFNNAGVETLNRPLHEIPADGWQRVISIDLEGVFLCLKHEIRCLLEDGVRGAIVNTASTLAAVAMRNGAEYVAAKHGVLGLTRAAAVDYAKNGIRVNAVLPGVIQTAIMSRFAADPSIQRLMTEMKAAHPLGRFGKPEEVAEAAAWLLSDKSSFVTGSALSVDGGFQAL